MLTHPSYLQQRTDALDFADLLHPAQSSMKALVVAIARAVKARRQGRE
jgi:hypothetical protein